MILDVKRPRSAAHAEAQFPERVQSAVGPPIDPDLADAAARLHGTRN